MPLFRRVILALLVLGGVAVFWRARHAKTENASGIAGASQSLPSIPAAHSPGPAPAPATVESAPRKNDSASANPAAPADAESPLERITTADALGAPEGDVHRDLTMLVTLFEDWRSFFPNEGNPWGDNAEITAQLLGKNRRKLVFIDAAHRALNADGELCDRWGTPFRFHALAGDRMEIRSAGPDKQFGTVDDAVVTPP